MSPSAWAALLVLVAIGVASGLLAGGARGGPRSGLAIGLAGAGVVVPAFIEGAAPFYPAALALMSMGFAMRTLDLVTDPTPRSPAFRVALLFTLFDLRQATAEPRRLDAHLLGWGLAHVVLAGLAAAVAATAEPHGAGLLLRWASGALMFYSGLEAVNCLVRASSLLLGWQLKPLQLHPILSKSLSEFWGRRWNMVVHHWVRAHVFVPVARRVGAASGLAAAFAFTALLHAWPSLVSMGAPAAASMTAFFLLQGALLSVERRLRVRRWPFAFARLWTVGWMALTAPLFVEPGLQIFSL